MTIQASGLDRQVTAPQQAIAEHEMAAAGRMGLLMKGSGITVLEVQRDGRVVSVLGESMESVGLGHEMLLAARADVIFGDCPEICDAIARAHNGARSGTMAFGFGPSYYQVSTWPAPSQDRAAIMLVDVTTDAARIDRDALERAFARAAIEHDHSGVGVFGDRGQLVHANPLLREWVGIAPEADPRSAGSADQFRPLFERSLATNEGHRDRLELSAGPGRRSTFDADAVPLYDDAGDLVGVAVFLRPAIAHTLNSAA